MRPATPHTITLQPSSFRNLRLPKRLRVIYFFARTRLAQRLIMVRASSAVWCTLPTHIRGLHFQKKKRGFLSSFVPLKLRVLLAVVVSSGKQLPASPVCLFPLAPGLCSVIRAQNLTDTEQ